MLEQPIVFEKEEKKARVITSEVEAKPLGQRFVYYLKRDKTLYLMLLLPIAGFVIFKYVPIITGFIIPFVDYNLFDGVWGSKWVGFKYFKQFFEDPFFFRLIRNTLLLGIYGLIFGFPGPIILALLFNELRNQPFKRVAQSISYLPHFVSTVVMVGILYNLFGFQGTANQLIGLLGGKAIKFFSNPGWFRPIYIGSGIWQGIGWSTIIYLASLAGINPELYESAHVDGANRWRQAIHITLPGMMPTVSILLIFAVAGIVSVGFEKAFLMQNPAIYETADVISTYVYRRGIVGMDFSFGQAIGLFNAAIAIILLTTANYISKIASDTSLW